MASNTVFFCKECGYESAKWLGRCPGCNNWNTFVEEKVSKKSSSKSSGGRNTTFGGSSTVKKLNDIVVTQEIRLDTGYEELNRVFGGGIVEGSLNLIGGEPGIGKSTLIMQVCSKLANHGKVLYISGEESETQVKLRADRLNVKSDNILFFNETNIEVIEEKLEELAPKFCIVDSIQTMYDEQISSTPGSISQVKEVTGRLMYQAKKQNITTIVIGHVTKDGVIAGPRILEHMVDTVIYIEGERFLSHRIVRGVKNRFGSTNEVGMFEMQEKGMMEITNPSSILISEREDNPPGSIIVASIEGTRPLLIELQALTTPTVFGLPRRTANGIDYNRLTVLMAVLEKRANMNLGSQDVYLNVVSGIKLQEPAVDLGVILAVSSCFKGISIPKDVVAIGEVGLTGEVRAVSMIEKRLKEAEKLGFKKCIIPENNKKLLKDDYKLDIIGVRNINEALKMIK